MDIVSRLKEFISYLGIQVTQFADNCTIPRPSMSQLLNGRNKKVSNELIGKIHEAYPELSVLWLMFGQGKMLINDSKPFSESQTPSTIDFSSRKSFENPQKSPTQSLKNDSSIFRPDNSFQTKSSSEPISEVSDEETKSFSPKAVPNRLDSTPPLSFSINASSSQAETPRSAPVTLSTNTSKQIVNIIVYYSDNSFESFVPGSL